MPNLTEHTVRFCCPEHIYEKIKSLFNAGAGRVYVWKKLGQIRGYDRNIFTVSTESDPPESQFWLFGCINQEVWHS